MAEQWLSIVEYARKYKISDMTIRRRIKTGKLEAVLQDGKYFIPMSAIDQQNHFAEEEPTAMHHYQEDSQTPSTSRIQSQGPMTIVKGHPQPRESIAQAQSYQSTHSFQNKQNFQPHQDYQRVGPSPFSQRSHGPQGTSQPQTPPVFRTQAHQPSQTAPERGREAPRGDYPLLPENLWRPLLDAPNALVDTKALLAYCEATVRKANELERKAIDRFKSKLDALDATIVAKDTEIKSLRQQIEDMQLLVKIIERRK